LTPELLERPCREFPGFVVGGISKNHLIHDLRDPAVVAGFEVVAGARDHRRRSAHVFNILLRVAGRFPTSRSRTTEPAPISDDNQRNLDHRLLGLLHFRTTLTGGRTGGVGVIATAATRAMPSSCHAEQAARLDRGQEVTTQVGERISSQRLRGVSLSRGPRLSVRRAGLELAHLELKARPLRRLTGESLAISGSRELRPAVDILGHVGLRPVDSNGARQAAACPALVASFTSTKRPLFTS